MKKRQSLLRKLHQFLILRNMKEAFIVCRIDDYNLQPNQRGGFGPGAGQYLGKGGMLWPTEEKAVLASQWVLNQPDHKNKGHIYGVFKLTAIVEEKEPVIPAAIVTHVA